MGTATILDNDVQRTYTVIGTPHYMAPEIINNKGYTSLCDLWALGVMMFEMLLCYFPFADEEDDPYAIYKIISLADHICFDDEDI